MGRAPNSGAPQRVSPHVVPKASPFSDEEDEKTTIESGWEEEASTTVEQGEVAEKIRTLGLDAPRRNITNVTSTNAGTVVDEPTVDDQRANAAHSMLTPQSVLARLLITHGNDSGQEIEILPGKSYTIGRAIDNDVVLTDIAVSRKHFDLRHEAGTWVLVDRGSGNGTLVNGNVEDQPFMLANGDTIEIGNTSFRFDNPNGANRAQVPSPDAWRSSNGPSNATYDVDVDEEEPSTVAGKPVRDDPMTPLPIPAPPMRPRTAPPPAPFARPRPTSGPPPMSAPAAYPLGSQGMPVAAQPTIAPHQAMQPLQHPAHLNHAPHQGMQPSPHVPQPHPQTRPPLGSMQPTMLQMDGQPLPNVMPTTIPGQGTPMQPSSPQMQGLPFTYPNLSDHPQHAKMLVATNQHGRDPTAHVPPTPFAGMQAMPQQVYVAPQISRRTKLLLGGAGLTILAAIATIAIIKGSSKGAEPPTPTPPPQGSSSQKPLAQPIDPKPPVKSAAKTDPKLAAKTDPPKADVAKTDPRIDPKLVAKTDPPKVDPPKIAKADPPKVDPPKVDPPKIVKADPPKVDPPKIAKADPPKTPPKVDPPKVDPPKIAKADPPKVDPPKIANTDPPKVDPKKPKKDPKKAQTKRVATGGSNTSDVKSKADALYRAKKFNDAATTLKTAASSLSGSEVGELKNLAGMYEQFGRNYNVGMAPGTPAAQAWDKLKSAQTFDSRIGGAYAEEIQTKRSQIATKAALAFVGAKNFSSALEAVRVAEQGGKNGSTGIVRDSIESHAGELYNAAAKEMDSNPDAAKSKLRQIKGLVGDKSPWFQKANRLLNNN